MKFMHYTSLLHSYNIEEEMIARNVTVYLLTDNDITIF